MERFRVDKDSDGNPCIVSTNGTRIVFTSPEEGESAVVAQRTAAMLDQHSRLEALELGYERSYSGYSTPPHSIGSEHIEDRVKLLDTAHQAEAHAERWAEYRDLLRQVLNPPDLAEIDAAPGVGKYLTEPRFGRVYPRNAREVPPALRESLMLALSYATVNLEAYDEVARQCRLERAERYDGEDAALREQAAAQMADELEGGA